MIKTSHILFSSGLFLYIAVESYYVKSYSFTPHGGLSSALLESIPATPTEKRAVWTPDTLEMADKLQILTEHPSPQRLLELSQILKGMLGNSQLVTGGMGQPFQAISLLS